MTHPDPNEVGTGLVDHFGRQIDSQQATRPAEDRGREAKVRAGAATDIKDRLSGPDRAERKGVADCRR
jgi:hypothetical protein